MKGCITTSVVRKMQIKISMRNYFTLSCLVNTKNPTMSSVAQGGEQEELSAWQMGSGKDTPTLESTAAPTSKGQQAHSLQSRKSAQEIHSRENHASEYVFNSCTICDGKMLEATMHPSKIGQKN